MILIILFLFISIVNLSCVNFPFLVQSKSNNISTSLLICSLRGKSGPIENAKRFGFFSSKLWENYEENLKSEIDVFGAIPGYILWYIQMGDEFPFHVVEHNSNIGISTVINHDLKSDALTPERNAKLLKEIVHGKWDDYFQKFARKAREYRIDIYYRFGYEMNGNWFPWAQQPKVYIDAWRHVWKIFRKEKAENIKWVFSPSVVWGQKNFKKDILPYYPGEQYVDIVALDGYNFGDYHSKYHTWESFFEIYGKSVSGLMSFNKPMWIAEIGCPSDPRRQKWLRDFLEFFDNNNCFEVFFWFNENKPGEPNFRIDGDDASLFIFREWAQRINNPHISKDDLARH